MSKIRVNYKSDLPPVAVKFKINGNVVDVPDHDFVVRFFVDGFPGTSFECIHKGDEYINCAKTADDTLTCYIDNHKFGCGRLCCEFIDLSADSRYSDKVLKTVTPSCLDVVLVEGAGDDNIEVLNVIFGYEINEIARITTEESQLDGGTNIVTITQSNGDVHVFGVKNGKKGEKGDPGKNGVYINLDTGEEEVPDFNIVDDLVTGGSTDALSAEQGKVLNNTKPTISEGSDDTDLDVVDEDGYVLARFSNGGIETKNFDSGKTVSAQTDNYDMDLGIADDNGNYLVGFLDGGIKTKNFDSRDFAKKEYVKSNFFTINEETTQPNTANLDTAAGINTYTTAAVYSDYGVLYLPATYQSTGTPTKLVICCKWGGKSVTASSSPVFEINIFDYIRHLGYAILMMDGEPSGWRTALGIDQGYVNGSYVAVQSFMRGYDKVVKEWNIDKDGCYIFGYSQGGWCASNIVDNANIPIKACALLSPVLSLEWQSWNSTNTATFDGQTYKGMKYRLAKVFGITGWSTPSELDAIPYQPDKFRGYDPYMFGAINPFRSFVQNGALPTVALPTGTTIDDITMQRPLKCPYKIWVASNDSTIGNVPTRVFVKAARNAGSNCSLSYLSSGGHNIYNGQTSIGTFVDDVGTTKNIYPIAYEVGKWFQEFGGYNVTSLE